MLTISASSYDRILDHATQAAIQQAEQDFPRFFEQATLVESALMHAHLMLATFETENVAAEETLYTAIFLAAAPTASSHSHSL
jgi:hypothetical protein